MTRPAPRPTLSVALCTYDGERFLGEQLASIAGQTRPPDELVVRDDGSTDATVEVVRAFAATAPFPVRVVEGATNVGYAKNFEAAVGLCAGDVVALADQDDVWLPAKLERLEAALVDGGAVLAFSDAALVDGRLRPLGPTLWESLRFGPDLQARVRAGGGGSPLFWNPLVTGAACAFRASLLRLALPFPLPYWHDAWLATLAAASGRVEPVSEPLLLYRQHGGNALGAPARRTARELAGALWEGASGRRPPEDVTRPFALYSAARDRLGPADPSVRAALDRRVEHARFRAELPPMPARLPAAVRELARGRYGRYSKGVRGFVLDLCR